MQKQDKDNIDTVDSIPSDWGWGWGGTRTTSPLHTISLYCIGVSHFTIHSTQYLRLLLHQQKQIESKTVVPVVFQHTQRLIYYKLQQVLYDYLGVPWLLDGDIVLYGDGFDDSLLSVWGQINVVFWLSCLLL